MMNKLGTDHAKEPEPKSAANIDLVRNGVTFDTPEALAVGYVFKLVGEVNEKKK